MRTEIDLIHGEVNVHIEPSVKEIMKGYGCTYIQQTFFVRMIDCFDDITLEVKANLRSDLYVEWEFVHAHLSSLGDDVPSDLQMADELINNHGIYRISGLQQLTDDFESF